MRKYQKAAVVMAMLGSVSFLGAGVGHADGGGDEFNNKQSAYCSADNTDITGTEAADTDTTTNSGVAFIDNGEHAYQDCDNVLSFGK
jgi:hypothetical protein